MLKTQSEYARGITLKRIDLTGKRFGMLVVTGLVDCKSKKRLKWRCICDCGKSCSVLGESLRSGNTKSCGCRVRQVLLDANTKHGKANTKLYGVWCSMKSRCYNEKSSSYVNYGKRGITICDEWKNDFAAFYDWAVQNGYSDGLSIDRIDFDGNYEPKNCRWSDSKEQANNRRSSRLLSLNGQVHSVSEWSRITGIKTSTLYMRLNKYGWNVEKTLCTPVKLVSE